MHDKYVNNKDIICGGANSILWQILMSSNRWQRISQLAIYEYLWLNCFL